MMKPLQRFVVCIVSALFALVVSVVMIAFGLRESVSVAAAVPAASGQTP